MKSGRTSASSAKAKKRAWSLYVLRCRDGSLYCGITNDLPRRLDQHDRGKAARYTRGRGPVKLVKSWRMAGLSAALKAERAFKRLSRAAKEKKLRARVPIGGVL